MPGGFPLLGGLVNAQAVSALTTVGGHSRGVAVTASGSTNTMGAWTQLNASVPNDCVGVIIGLAVDDGSFAANYAVNIGVGGSGSEQTIIQDLILVNTGPSDGGFGSGAAGTCYYFPINIPAGTRLAAQVACTSASKVCHVNVMTLDGDFTQSSGVSMVEAIGFSAGSTTGTAIPLSSSTDVATGYTQITASTPNDYEGFCFAVDFGGGLLTWTSNILFDIAIGAGGSEQVIFPKYYFLVLWQFPGTAFGPTVSPFVPMRIRAGTRIAARLQSDLTGSTPSPRLTLYGVR